MPPEAQPMVQLHLRLPQKLHRRLMQQAKRNNASLQTEIVNQLEGYDAGTVKRTTEIVQPLLDEAVKAAASEATRGTLVFLGEVLKRLPWSSDERDRDWLLRLVDAALAAATREDGDFTSEGERLDEAWRQFESIIASGGKNTKAAAEKK
jgi:hypothetical protein